MPRELVAIYICIQDAVPLSSFSAHAVRYSGAEGLAVRAGQHRELASEVVRMNDARRPAAALDSPVARALRNAALRLPVKILIVRRNLAARLAELGN